VAFDLHNNIDCRTAFFFLELTASTNHPGEVIDTSGFDSVEFIVHSDKLITDDPAILLEESEEANFSESNVLDSGAILGPLARDDAAITNTVIRVGTVSKKRYQRLSLVSDDATPANAFFSAVVVLSNPKSSFFVTKDATVIPVDDGSGLSFPIFDGSEQIAISTQAEFEAVFGSGAGPVTISDHTTVFLAPIQDAGAPFAYNGKKAYSLKNDVSILSGTSIIGFNEADTLILRGSEDVHFEIMGVDDDNRVTNVRLAGWAFDGQGGVNGLAGSFNSAIGAFDTAWCRDCIISCRIVNHNALNNGGALRDNGNSDNMTIDRIYDCESAQNGGGVYGCNDANIVVTNCIADQDGGGVAVCNKSVINAYKCTASVGGGANECDNSTINVYNCNSTGIAPVGVGGGAHECNNSIIVARNCSATLNGGGVHNCDYITMTAINCSATVDGGGAYDCKRMVCVGSWSGNSSGMSDNIHATDSNFQYLGLFAVDDTSVFENDWTDTNV